ncbi:MAG TPA: hypothetical protein VF954_03905 [Acidimicrobiales bacterium]
MSMLWWLVPTCVAAGLAVPAVVAALRAADEARALGRAVTDLGSLRPALVEVRSGADAVRQHLLDLRSR